MVRLMFMAFLNLIRFDVYVARHKFAALYQYVRGYPLSSGTRPQMDATHICSAVDKACLWYWKDALCLQRSATAACLLKKFGFNAQLVIGAQQLPFRAHAWVELDGRVVNDKPYMEEIYSVLDRC